MRGRFITFDGIDGCGKTTQLWKVGKRLLNYGYNVKMTLEPGGTKLGSGIRRILLETDSVVDPRTESMLFFADRAQHVGHVIRPALVSGKVVLCDRHCFTTYAFQGYARGMDLEELAIINSFATGGLDADLAIIFDLPVEIARYRLNQRATDPTQRRFDDEKLAFHRSARKGFLAVAEEFSERTVVVDANRPVEEVFEDVYSLISGYLIREGVAQDGLQDHSS